MIGYKMPIEEWASRFERALNVNTIVLISADKGLISVSTEKGTRSFGCEPETAADIVRRLFEQTPWIMRRFPKDERSTISEKMQRCQRLC